MKPVKSGLDSISRYLRTKKEVGRRKIGLLVDGPNILRKEFDVNLEEIRDVLKDYGNIKIGRVFLNQYASDKLVEAIENHGLEPIICSSDVDVRLAVEGMELVYNPNIDTLAIVTRDADFKPLLNKANEHGKETIIFGVEPGFSTALKNSADYVILMGKDSMSGYDIPEDADSPEKKDSTDSADSPEDLEASEFEEYLDDEQEESTEKV